MKITKRIMKIHLTLKKILIII